MTKEEEKNAMFSALMEITQIVKKVKTLNPSETEFLQKELMKWFMGIKADTKGAKNGK